MFPLTDAQKAALAELQKRGIENRIAWIIIAEGFLTFEDFCAKHTAREMLRIPGFGDVSLQKVIGFAAENGISINDDRLLPMTRKAKIPAKPKRQKWEFKVLDIDDRYRGGDILDMLNSYGVEGWDWAGVFRSMLIMKRPAQ